ncbi:MAG: enolase [Alteromonas naphthalenivorans]
MKIARVSGREIFDSRGIPALMCEIALDDGSIVTASVPSGASCGQHEAKELRDGGDRLFGKGLLKAIHNLDHVVAPVLVGKEPDIMVADALLINLDGTQDKSKLGANVMLAASIAVCKAQAVMHQREVFELIAELYGSESVSLPFPLVNVINGGAHATNGFPIQEIMLVPVGAQNFRISLEYALTVFRELKRILVKNNKSTGVGDEGGFAPFFENVYEPFDYLVQALENTKLKDFFVLAIDVAANQFYDSKKKTYSWYGAQISSKELLDFYKKLADSYPLYSIEDGMAEEDVEGWKAMYKAFGSSLQIVGDDIFVTQAKRIQKGFDQELVNGVIIKPNQVGTVSEALEAASLCHAAGANVIVSHRSGETNDDFIADFAVGTSSGQIKIGGLCRGERIAKYNRLLYIEDMLTMALLDKA